MSLKTLLFFVAVVFMHVHVAFGSGLTLKTQLADGWLVEYRPEFSMPARVVLNGKEHLLFSHPGDIEDHPDPIGMPMLPVETIMMGLPEGGSLHVALLDSVYEMIEEQDIAPIPDYVTNDEGERVALYRKSMTAYSRNDVYPAMQFVVDPPTEYRDQRIASFRISPYQYNPVTKTLRRLVGATLKIEVRGTDGNPLLLPQTRRSVDDPFFEETFKQLLWNYEQAKSWRLWRSLNRLRTDPRRDWFETGKAYYKMPITENGWHKVTRAQLIAAGALGSQIDIPTLKLFYKGNEIPIVVRPDTTVEFYGLRNRTDSTYFDTYTDTSAYWLTWGGSQGLRYASSLVDSLPPIQNVQTAYTTKHFEENTDYFYGISDPEIIDPEVMPGEGWGWGVQTDWFFPNTTRTFPFVLDNFNPDTSLPVLLTARFVGTTQSSTQPNHRVRFTINASSVSFGDTSFNSRTGIIRRVVVPSGLLSPGEDTLNITSVSTNTIPNRFYLDWFEFEYSRTLRAADNRLEVSYPASRVSQRVSFTVTGFTSPQVEVYDVATKRLIASVRIAYTGGEYVATFRDTLSTSRQYVIVAPGAARSVASVREKFFDDIRVNPSGADYIVIAHRNFLPQAQQLAAHRQSANGVRVKVVDVQALYDEFNYGIKNPLALKLFTKHAYEAWAAPRPSSLLLFGDACWDFQHFRPTTTNIDFVPSYGVPVTDNWYVAFNPDTSILPFMHVGRFPARTPQEAQSMVNKVVGYDSYALGEWNKIFFFIAGNDPAFRSDCEQKIATKILPAPIGGTALRAYKSTLGAIDGELMQYMRNTVRDGVSYINFVGHSGGRIWEVDIGSPYTLENTNGRLPFISSVSCNVGAFAEPSTNALSEDFLLAENRGGVAFWASSTLGYPSYSNLLGDSYLQGVRDSVRGFGSLTTAAKIKLARSSPFFYIVRSTVQCNNLMGDPMSRFALPTKPDLSVTPQDISLSETTPTTNDSLVTMKVLVKNFGLVTTDSVAVSLSDTYNGMNQPLLTQKLAPLYQRDSLRVPWRNMQQVGLHTLSVNADPENRIGEVTELNNIASRDQYVYANLLSVVKPIRNMVVPPGVQRLVVSSPFGVDSSGFHYVFELDTVETFDSPAFVASSQIIPNPVSGEWLTPSLPAGRVYFWRARTGYGSTLGKWVESSFSTAADAPTLPTVRWKAGAAKQFRREVLNKTAAADSGVTLAQTPSVLLYNRSVGYRYNQLAEYYSTIRANDRAIKGYFFEGGVGTGFLAMRLDQFTGVPDFRWFNTPVTFPADSGVREAARMLQYIRETRVGDYLAFSVIFDGQTNVSESLKVALEQLGSTRIRAVTSGASWVLIGRKGNGVPGMPALEQLSNDTAAVAYVVPTNYSYGIGTVSTPNQFVSPSWESFHWRHAGVPATNARIALLGVRQDGLTDTLRLLPKDSIDVNLRFLNSFTSGERYRAIRTTAILSTADASVTPRLSEWSMDLVAPADLAISARTIGGAMSPAVRNIEITVYNIGYQESDSSVVSVAVADRQNRGRAITSATVLPIQLGSSRSVIVPVNTTNLPRRVTLAATVAPSKKSKDLLLDNNTAYYSFVNAAAALEADIPVYCNGVQLMDGDYVVPNPTLLLTMPERNGEVAQAEVRMFVNSRLAGTWSPTGSDGPNNATPTFTPHLDNGKSELRFAVGLVNSFGEVDSVERLLTLNVLSESRIVRMFNYPNPFVRDTYFTLVLSGSLPPDEMSVRIFTVAGRKIRELRIPSSSLQVGFNRIYWDGRDEEGDEVSNGYYFYQATMKGDGKVQSEIQKLAKVK